MQRETKMIFTDEETKFLLELLARLTINPTAPEAAATVAIVQSIANKLRTEKPDIK